MVAGQGPNGSPNGSPNGGSNSDDGCPLTYFWRTLARARVQAILNVFPSLAEEIRNGQLGPNPKNRGNGINQLSNDLGNQNSYLPSNNQQNNNRFPSPFNRLPSNNNRLPFNPFENRNNNNNQGGLLDGLNGQQNSLPSNNIPSNNLPSNGLGNRGGAELPSNNLIPSTLATPTVD